MNYTTKNSLSTLFLSPKDPFFWIINNIHYLPNALVNTVEGTRTGIAHSEAPASASGGPLSPWVNRTRTLKSLYIG